MRLDTATSGIQTLGSGDSIEAGIDEDRGGLIIKLLSQYSDPAGSIVRELTSNAFDSHQEAKDFRDLSIDELIEQGYERKEKDPEMKIQHLQEAKEMMKDWVERPIRVELIKANNLYSTIPSIIKFHDHGIGISPRRVKQIYSKYLGSTKDRLVGQIGAFGLGSKSPFGYTDLFTITTRYNKIEYKWVIQKGERYPLYSCVSEEPTDKPNGTTVEITIKVGDDHKFEGAIRTQLAYFDGIEYAGIDIPDYTIYRGKHFMARTNPVTNQMHLVLGKVHYPLNGQLVFNKTSSYYGSSEMACPVGLYFSMEELPGLDIMWSREQIEYTSKTIQTIRDKVELVKEELKEKYDKDKEKITNLKDFIRLSYHTRNHSLALNSEVTIPHVNSLISTGVNYDKYKKLSVANNVLDFFFTSHKSVDTANRVSPLYEYPTSYLLSDRQDKVFVLREKETLSAPKTRFILKEICPGGFSVFYLRNEESEVDVARRFGFYLPVDAANRDSSHKEIIEEIKELRKEVIALIEDEFTYYSDIEITKEFLEEEREERKAKRKSAKVKITDKISIPAKYLALDLYLNNFRWKVTTLKATDILSKHLILYCFGGEETLAEQSYAVLSSQMSFLLDTQGVLDNKKVKLYKISKTNVGFLKSNPNAMHVSLFLKGKSAVMRRFLTAEYIKRHFPESFRNLDFSYSTVLPSIQKDIDFLNSYISQYGNWYNRSIDNTFVDQLLETEEKRRKLVKKVKDLSREGTKAVMPQDSVVLLDYDVIDRLENVVGFVKKYPLLAYLQGNPPEGVLFDYLKTGNAIHPKLLARLAKKKEAGATPSTS